MARAVYKKVRRGYEAIDQAVAMLDIELADAIINKELDPTDVEDKGFYQVINAQLDIIGQALDRIDDELNRKTK